MIRFIITVVIALIALQNRICASTGSGRLESLRTELEEYASSRKAMVGIAVITDDGDTVVCNGDTGFPMMSVFKFPLALAVARWVDNNGKSFADSVSFDRKILIPGTYSPMVELYGARGNTLTLRELLEWSLVYSDNNACDILLDVVGGVEKANGLLSAIGLPEGIVIKVNEAQMHEDNKCSLLNTATPLAMAELFRRFDKELRHMSASFAEIAEIMEHCQTGLDRICAPIRNAVVGHKTGTGFAMPDGGISALNDCGYVRLDNGQSYSIAVFIANSKADMKATSAIIAGISAMVFDIFKDQ